LDFIHRANQFRKEGRTPLGVSRQTLYDLLEEKQPVTPMMVLRLGKLCGNGPDLWLNLQKRYDLQRASEQLGAKINAIPTLEVA
jgi:addiction module HigA family antidote